MILLVVFVASASSLPVLLFCAGEITPEERRVVAVQQSLRLSRSILHGNWRRFLAMQDDAPFFVADLCDIFRPKALMLALISICRCGATALFKAAWPSSLLRRHSSGGGGDLWFLWSCVPQSVFLGHRGRAPATLALRFSKRLSGISAKTECSTSAPARDSRDPCCSGFSPRGFGVQGLAARLRGIASSEEEGSCHGLAPLLSLASTQLFVMAIPLRCRRTCVLWTPILALCLRPLHSALETRVRGTAKKNAAAPRWRRGKLFKAEKDLK